MTIEQAIKDAIKGGWGKNYDDFVNSKDEWWGYPYQMEQDSFLLDPLFWQALGKTRGWKNKEHQMRDYGLREESESDGEECEDPWVCCKRGMVVEGWKSRWYSLLDHLATQRPINEFFGNLK